jgi:hypothetical protein
MNRKEMVVAYFKVLSEHFPGEPEKNKKIISRNSEY